MDSAAISAYAAVAQAVIASLALIGLVVYAIDTKKLRIAADAQLKLLRDDQQRARLQEAEAVAVLFVPRAPAGPQHDGTYRLLFHNTGGPLSGLVVDAAAEHNGEPVPYLQTGEYFDLSLRPARAGGDFDEPFTITASDVRGNRFRMPFVLAIRGQAGTVRRGPTALAPLVPARTTS